MSATTATTLSTGTHPDPARPEAGLAFISTWSTGSPERQRATLDAIARAWESRPWPHEGLLSYTVYAGFDGSDGSAVLHHSHWRDEEAYQDFFDGAHNGRDARNTEIDAAVPGIERLGLSKTRLYRSWSAASGGERREPGAIVIVRIVFDGPDAERQRAWVDGVLEALDSDPVKDKGLISAHFHVSTDGTEVVNYAEWETEQAHIDVLAAAEGVDSLTPQWRRVREFPGVTSSGTVARYRFAYGFVPSWA
ncbi:antibiotic biosynthesis monooxygenase [Streptomyces alboniger]|uniref:Antibiotic biosynthesis monooxygenase n=1 Tax=Streptomyces alboniger TaxID=132473 RepID=A0A5J6HJX3_STRAD|nr:antibiotic biosynthesis monooxygenase [Streptomyces alboniger]QEV17467.1 antibiotic biosynthesis monooxygenase [Streptomyces alboniger]